MPVYEQTYHHYTGVYRPRSQCWTVITLNGLKQAWRSKWVRFLLIFCNVNAVVFTGRMYLAANKELMGWLGMPTNVTDQLFLISDATFFEFLTLQFFSCWLMTLFIGSDLISMDRRTKSIALYLSKPLTRFDYVMGKGMTVMLALYAITLIPAFLMVFLNGIFMDDWYYWFESIPLLAKIFIYSNLICIPLTLVVLAISAINKSNAASSIIFSVVYFLPQILAGIIENILNETVSNASDYEPWLSLLSPQELWTQLGAALFGETDMIIDLHWSWHFIVLAAVCALCALILKRQIRAVDIVK